MIAQVQVLDVVDLDAAEAAVMGAEEELMRMCNDRPSTMIKLGGPETPDLPSHSDRTGHDVRGPPAC